MNFGILIGKLFLFIFVLFGIGILIYLFYILFKVSKKKSSDFLGTDSSPNKKDSSKDKSKFCSECGNKIISLNKFCPSCGSELK